MRRVLIVSPHFPPINAPDHQRIRMSLPYFREFGWEPIIIAVNPDEVEGTRDELLLQSVPSDIEVVRVGALPIRYTRPVGFGSLALRALPEISRAGSRIIPERKIDLSYFSTTMFATMALGRRWKEEFGTPYVLDFQDPWLSDYQYTNGATPPGGRLKYQVAQSIARTLEPYAMKRVDHVISVSPAYPKVLRKRYPDLAESAFTVLPFGAPESDFDFVRNGNATQDVFDPSDGNRHYVYIGRGGSDMHRALRIVFGELKRLDDENSELVRNVVFHFIGTSYAQGHRAEETIVPVAKEFGVEKYVREHVHRIGYHAAIRAMLDSDGILLIGSDDAGYTASKLYPCVLAKRPLLAVVHEASSVASIISECSAGRALTFGSAPDSGQSALEWLLTQPREYGGTSWSSFERYSAREMTRRQCEVFDLAVTSQDSGSPVHSQ